MTRSRSSVQSKQLRAIKEAIWVIPSCDDYHLVVLIESTFRPLAFRLAEYIWLLTLLIVNSPRAYSLTIGRNQLQYARWLLYLEHIDEEPRLSRVLLKCERHHDAKAATEWFLKSRNFDRNNAKSISQLYTGGRNAYYDGLFSEARKVLKKKPRRINGHIHVF